MQLTEQRTKVKEEERKRQRDTLAGGVGIISDNVWFLRRSADEAHCVAHVARGDQSPPAKYVYSLFVRGRVRYHAVISVRARRHRRRFRGKALRITDL